MAYHIYSTPPMVLAMEGGKANDGQGLGGISMFTLRFGWFALACLITNISASSWAQGYPAKPIRYITSGSAGSSADTLGRLLAEGLMQNLGQPVIVDARPGAGANLGAEIASKASADGYTVYQPTISQALNASLYRKLAYDLMRDFTFITQIATDPVVVVVHPSLPVKSISGLIKLAKAKPGALNYASAGTGTFTFLAGELFKGQAGINVTHVPYRGGGPALTAVISGEVSVYFAPLGVSLAHVRQGRVRALAVGTSARLSVAPELPTVAEAGLPGYEFANWYGLAAPAKTPKETIAVIHGAAVAALNSPALRQRISALGYVIVGSKPEEFAAYVKSEVEKLAKVVRELQLHAD